MEPNYTISGYATCTLGADGRAITCHRCTMTSYHPLDVAARYCATCRMFHQEVRMSEEIAAADSLVKENAELRAELLSRAEKDAEDTHRLQAYCDSLFKKVARLQAALAWYADVSHYHYSGAPGVFDPQQGMWLPDGGELARAALKEKETT